MKWLIEYQLRQTTTARDPRPVMDRLLAEIKLHYGDAVELVGFKLYAADSDAASGPDPLTLREIDEGFDRIAQARAEAGVAPGEPLIGPPAIPAEWRDDPRDGLPIAPEPRPRRGRIPIDPTCTCPHDPDNAELWHLCPVHGDES